LPVDVQGQKITVERLEIERRLLIISTEGFAADESHNQLRGDVYLEQVALDVAVLSFRQGSDVEGVLTYGYMAVPLANSLPWAINTPALGF
jgi:hypothetical protein